MSGTSSQTGAPLVSRFRGGRHGWERLVIDGDQRGRVGGLLARLGHHQGDRIADMAYSVARKRRPRRREGRRSIASLAGGVCRQVAEPIGRDVGPGQHRKHSWRPPRDGAIKLANARVRMRRADHDGVGLAGEVHVVGIMAETLDETRVLQAAHGLPDGKLFDDQWVAHDVRSIRDSVRAAIYSTST